MEVFALILAILLQVFIFAYLTGNIAHEKGYDTDYGRVTGGLLLFIELIYYIGLPDKKLQAQLQELIALSRHRNRVISIPASNEDVTYLSVATQGDISPAIDRSKFGQEMTFNESAEYLQISTDKLHSLAMGGQIQCIPDRSRPCFKKEVLDKYLESQSH